MSQDQSLVGDKTGDLSCKDIQCIKGEVYFGNSLKKIVQKQGCEA